jgi:hypothetical protein
VRSNVSREDDMTQIPRKKSLSPLVIVELSLRQECGHDEGKK